MLTQNPTCIGGGTSGTVASKTAAPSEQKKAKLACNRCRIRKQSCDKKLPHCSRCFKDNVVCTYNWQNKTSETTAVSKKPPKFHFKVFALKTYNDSNFNFNL
jgi:ribosomal protein L37E